MDPRLQESFQKSFDVLVTHIEVRQTSWSDPRFALVGRNSLSSIEQPSFYDIDIVCCFATVPPEYTNSLIWFDMRDVGHALHFVRTNSSQHANMMELRYRTSDYDKFIKDVADARYRRFSRHFHKQLEDILD